jgi:hypothetical protein
MVAWGRVYPIRAVLKTLFQSCGKSGTIPLPDPVRRRAYRSTISARTCKAVVQLPELSFFDIVRVSMSDPLICATLHLLCDGVEPVYIWLHVGDFNLCFADSDLTIKFSVRDRSELG